MPLLAFGRPESSAANRSASVRPARLSRIASLAVSPLHGDRARRLARRSLACAMSPGTRTSDNRGGGTRRKFAATNPPNRHSRVPQNPRNGFGPSGPVCCLAFSGRGQDGAPHRLSILRVYGSQPPSAQIVVRIAFPALSLENGFRGGGLSRFNRL